jgi:acetyltransferase-like isoleucine patch superfamily enzyme
MEDFPLVTIGIANYNDAGFVTQALNSVASQTYPNIELIIVDDGSTDNSMELIDNWMKDYKGNFPVKLIKNTAALGKPAVSNIILDNTSGKYYQILDADDIILPDKIQSQVSRLEKHKNSALIYSNIGVLNNENEIITDDYLKRIGYDEDNMPAGNVFNQLLKFNFIPNPSVLINTSLAEKIGGYDEMFQLHDYYLSLTLSEHYPVIYTKEVTARVHETSLSRDNKPNPDTIEDMLHLLSRYYYKGDREFRARFKKSVFNMAPHFYKNNYPSAKYWINRNVVLNPGFRSLRYYAAIHLGIPYTVSDNAKPNYGSVKSKIYSSKSWRIDELLFSFFKIMGELKYTFQELFSALHFSYYYYTSKQRFVMGSSIIGKRFIIESDATDTHIFINNNCRIRDNFNITIGNNGRITIGENCFFNNNCSMSCVGEIEIGNNNRFGEGVLMDDNPAFSEETVIPGEGENRNSIKIGNNCRIGANVVILKNVEIGDNVLISAGCLINRSIPSNTVITNRQAL